MKKYIVLVSLRGDVAWYEGPVECIINDNTEETLNKLRKHIKKRYGVEVKEFIRCADYWKACTSSNWIVVYLKETKEL